MELYLLRMFKTRYSHFGLMESQKNYYFEIELNENLDDYYRYKTAKEQHPNLHFGDLIPLKNELPKGWKRLDGALTAPKGYYWASNGKSFFSKERKSALIKE